ncbi:MAG: succinylglutamate desuccinylase/aspartoacylase family protein [Planctomycetes bacterium]|nr:succinylglutamate desuccinylase/aspartoacylase family protein [Planctomycetota bacterium]MCB9908989.1 succinylglutamate desuccinylase/aspartoacylase family protein [Planctomycetota bacterium]MCB9911764.1 succinylglutamate desuccinylase/aspartoacylase family protein [Planctomycetota bacterium]HPF15746.1 succinylglutamate desuccinylase/aspartoacylase family protein [Planctomycetota bacterium]HRV81056.1 succinylglutamate desuccinylase/aspartoacylase family protein [Planctomycetota bacterium]
MTQPIKKPRSKSFHAPIVVEDVPLGTRQNLQLPVYENALGHPVLSPFVVVRGAQPGPVLGICAATHGDELNGINIIHRLLDSVDAEHLHGTLLCCPVVNVPAFEAGQRRFPEDDRDLNTCFPGRVNGTPSQQYARSFLERFLKSIDYLVDIHTASEGRLNSLYVRADWYSPAARDMARLLQPQIILHGRSGDKTLRSAARALGVPAVTLEAGNPSVFQGKMALEGEAGIRRVMAALGMIENDHSPVSTREPVLCDTSQWLRTIAGGILEQTFELCEVVQKGQVLARLKNAFGEYTAEYKSPSDGIVIGMSRTPLAVPGTRYCHLGRIGLPAPPKQPAGGRLLERLAPDDISE